MKKICTLLVCSLVVLTAACGKPAAQTPAPGEGEPAETEPAAAESDVPEDWPEGWPTTAPLAYGEIELPQLSDMKEGEQIAVMTTNYGDITFRFFPEDAPKAVENFLTHAKDGYYEGVIFHRVVPNYVIQGGDPTGTGMGGESMWGEVFENEVTPKLHHITGALGMANSGPDTNGSQFYIVQNGGLDPNTSEEMKGMRDNNDRVVNQDEDGKFVTIGDFFPPAILDKYLEDGGVPFLDSPFGSYTVFGQVIDGMDTVNAIGAVEFEEQPERPGEGKPVNDVVIEKIVVTEYKK